MFEKYEFCQKIRLWKCEFWQKWEFDNVNFVKNDIFKMWISSKLVISKCEFCQKWDFQNVNFRINWGLCYYMYLDRLNSTYVNQFGSPPQDGLGAEHSRGRGQQKVLQRYRCSLKHRICVTADVWPLLRSSAYFRAVVKVDVRHDTRCSTPKGFGLRSLVQRRLWQCEFSEKWDFKNVNSVKIEIFEMWILWKLSF